MPSGVGPTVTVSTTRDGFACMSMTLIVSTSPWLRPMFATTAISPFGRDVEAVGPQAGVEVALGGGRPCAVDR